MIGKIIPVLLLFGIHILFLSQVVWPKFEWWTLLSIIPFLGYLTFVLKPVSFHLKEFLFSVLFFGIGFYAVQLACEFYGVTPVYAAALVGIIASFLKWKQFLYIQPVLYSGAFSGMIADYHIESVGTSLGVIGLGSLLFYGLKDHFEGLGGKLGSIGFGALLFPVIAGNEQSFLDEVYDEVFSIDLVENLTSYEELSFTIIISLFAGVLVYFLNNHLKLGAIKASAIPSFIVAIPFQLVPFSGYESLIPIVFFGASFVAMSSKVVLGWVPVLISLIIYAVLFFLLRSHFNGIGGTFGTTACLSCLVGSLIQFGLRKAFQGKSIGIQSET